MWWNLPERLEAVGKLPRWVESRLAAASPGWGEPPAHLETGGLCPKPKEDLRDPGESDTDPLSEKRPFRGRTVPSHRLLGLREQEW